MTHLSTAKSYQNSYVTYHVINDSEMAFLSFTYLEKNNPFSLNKYISHAHFITSFSH
jgi:hypothetical protein